MSIAAWLRRIGLEEYEPVFRANAIDTSILPRLTANDLRDMGITLVGHRRKLLDAIAALAPAAGPPPTTVVDRAHEAERRHLTVMFVDLIGSTALSTRLDPEEMREVIRGYQNAVAGEITRFEGHVAKFMGDGILAYFGWPRAHEDDAERAVRAGLAVAQAVGGLTMSTDMPLAARIGIASGIVVVGDLVGEGAAQEEAVIGETPNLAARLQSLAGPGEVVVALATRRLLGSAFILRELAPQLAKGIAQPVWAFVVDCERPVASRFAARGDAAFAPMVGRDQELSLLIERWERAKAGEGQMLLLVGEAGIGKSRICEALAETVAAERHPVARYQCSPFHVGSALWPVIRHVGATAGISPDRSLDEALQRLQAWVGEGVTAPAAAVPVLASLLGLDAEQRYGQLDLSPQARRQRTMAVLTDHLLGRAGRQPVLVLVEDAHWIDPTTLELVERWLDRIAAARVLIVVTSRPDNQPAFVAHPHATRLTLNRLGRSSAEAIVTGLAGDHALPGDVVEAIVNRTDGIPLFVEELTKAVIETGQASVPASLHDSLMARLDRIPEVKELAQVAACIGREFDFRLLAAVAGVPEAELRSALERLGAAGLVFRRGSPPEASYTFKHALVRDVAYQSILRGRREQLHRTIAEAVERQFPDVAVTQSGWLARHWAAAASPARAADLWLDAGRSAKKAFAKQEAAAHLRACLAAIESAERAPGAHPELASARTEALVLLGDLASLSEDLPAAEEWYLQAIDAAPDGEQRRGVENKRHRPGATFRGGARIAYYEHGSGDRTLLFVSTQAVGLATFQPIIEQLCDEFRIVTVDPRGSGGSDPLIRPYLLGAHVADVQAVLSALGPRRLVGVGISMGANVLFRLSHAEPTRFERLIAIGCPAAGHKAPFFPAEWLELQEQTRRSGDVAAMVRRHVSYVFSEPEMREMLEGVVRTRLQLPRDTLLSFFLDDSDDDVTSILPEVATPTLLLHGAEDRLVSVRASELAASLLPAGSLHVFEGKGHLPIFTATHRFCDVLRDFIRGTPSMG